MLLPSIRKQFRSAFHDSAALTTTAILMLLAFVPAVFGVFLDERVITGVPAWLKPAKFALSSAIYAATLAWLYRHVRIWPRFLSAMGRAVAAILILEVGIIYIQAARGTTSHFNAATLVDGILFGIMGVSIFLLWLASVGILIALLKQRFQNAAWGWSLRLGMFISLLGSGAGGLMLRMTPEQAREMHQGRVSSVGGHTVGAPDGGTGLPATGWSTEHGDLRIPHFFGMHALQILPALSWLLTRRRHHQQVEIVLTTAGSYLTLLLILTWQALRGQPLVGPDADTLIALGTWAVSTAVAFLILRHRAPDARLGSRHVTTPSAQRTC